MCVGLQHILSKILKCLKHWTGKMPQTMAQILQIKKPMDCTFKSTLFEKKTKLMTSFVYILVYMETFAVT